MAKRKGYGRRHVAVVREQAAAYGVSVPDEPTSAERFLSPNEIGRILNVTGEAVKQWIYNRRLPAVKLANGYWKVRVADFEAFLKARHEVGRRQVLVTDSLAGGMRDVVEAVAQLGHQPVVSYNYADALLKSLEHQPALFVINVGIKEVEPWKLAERIRATKAIRNVPILFVANSELSEADAERALKLEAQGFVMLPAEKAALAAEIGRIVNRH